MGDGRSTSARGRHPEAPIMDNFVSVFDANELHTPQIIIQPQQEVNSPFQYLPEQHWQSTDVYGMPMDLGNTYSDLSQMNSGISSANISPITRDNLTPFDSPFDFAAEAYSPTEPAWMLHADASIQESPCGEMECSNHERCINQHDPCEVCQRDKKEKRKEQNRKAQRNHRMRSEAKLDLLRSKVKTQADEIVMLKGFNQSLLKHIETLEGKDTGNDISRTDDPDYQEGAR